MPPQTVPPVDRFTGWPGAALQFFAGLRRDSSKTYLLRRTSVMASRSWRPAHGSTPPRRSRGSAKPGETPNR
jgi:hypothetical protein